MFTADATPDARRYLAAFVAQLVLTGLAVLVSRFAAVGVMNTAMVMALAAVNAATVAIALMGVRRDGRLVSGLVLMTLFFIIGLLVWPAWDIAERGRMY